VRHAYVSARTGDRVHYRSRKLAYFADSTARHIKEFPYDVPYLTSKEVWKLVSLSKQYWVSDVAMYRLKHEFDLPESLLSQLKPLHSPDGLMRFFEDEFWHEAETKIGIVALNQWRTQLRRAATEGFLRQETSQWTPERAKAHLQDDDPVMKRASTHPDLWAMYIQYRDAGRPITEQQLRRWIDIKRLEENLTPPTWFIDQQNTRDTTALQRLWFDTLREKGVDIEKVQKSHYDLFEQAKRDLL
jgi:hypothetical protein